MSTYKDNSFPVMKGHVNLGVSVQVGGGTFLCVEDGALVATWQDDTTDSFTMTAGNAYNFGNIKQVQILSGKFHRA